MARFCVLCFVLFGMLPFVQAASPGAVFQPDYEATRTESPPVIDGNLEDLWFQAPRGEGFWMHDPYDDRPPSFPTYFYILYDDDALYIACIMIDPSPDSILNELGPRNDFSHLNADHISIDIFPFNDGLNGVAFKVSPSNLQADEKYSATGTDRNWDAVWESATAITDSGWVAEVKIPWSALRFSQKDEQVFGFSIWRKIRRYREWSTWGKLSKEQGNIFSQYGTLSQLKDIDPPVRLSVMPYISGYADFQRGEDQYYFNGGMDLKYGINESFTLDMTLIPDFGQVPADDIVLNLSPFEIQYDERRQFFTEGTELFHKGNIFYSRRIGDRPADYYQVSHHLEEGEKIVENPSSNQLINATKISGRTRKGTGLGFFNAMTHPSQATIEDSLGEQRTIQTQPFTNYNMMVVDQNLPRNSYIALVNTNVASFETGYYANVTGTDLNLKTSNQKYSLGGIAMISQKYNSNHPAGKTGYMYDLQISKESGKFLFDLNRKTLSATYDPNDMGYLTRNNYTSDQISLTWRTINPRWIALNWNSTLSAEQIRQYAPNKFSDVLINLSSRGTLKNHLSLGINLHYHPVERNDFHEARQEQAMFIKPPEQEMGFWFSSDYRKRLAIDGGAHYEQAPQWNMKEYMVRLEPRIRVNNHMFLTMGSRLETGTNQRGYITHDQENNIVFGSRNTQTLTNTITARYIFNVKHGVHLRARHYWATVRYNDIYYLKDNGKLNHQSTHGEQYNINFNAFNLDLSYNWRFAPGSEMSVVWKNELLDKGNQLHSNYLHSIKQVLGENQFNSFSIKILYYLDYAMIRN